MQLSTLRQGHRLGVARCMFAGVTNDMRIAQEEIFGPVVVVIPYDHVDEAVDIANDSPYGLSGAVYARDPEVAEALARRIRTVRARDV